MQTKEKSGVGYIPKTAEELAPYKYWISWLKKIAVNVVRSYHLPVDIGYKYKVYDHWEILILHAFKNLPLDETSDRHNQLLYDMKNSHRCHKKGLKMIMIENADYARMEIMCENTEILSQNM